MLSAFGPFTSHPLSRDFVPGRQYGKIKGWENIKAAWQGWEYQVRFPVRFLNTFRSWVLVSARITSCYIYGFRIFRTLNHVVFLVFTPIVVHAVHIIFMGYLSLRNSITFCWALDSSAPSSLAIFCTFVKQAIIVLLFCSKAEWQL